MKRSAVMQKRAPSTRAKPLVVEVDDVEAPRTIRPSTESDIVNGAAWVRVEASLFDDDPPGLLTAEGRDEIVVLAVPQLGIRRHYRVRGIWRDTAGDVSALDLQVCGPEFVP